MNILEIIALNEKDIEELNTSNVDRIEFCQDINEDGLTPSIEKLKRVLKITKKPINVMLRPSNSFVLSKKDDTVLINSLWKLKKLKRENKLLNGIVIGYITQENKLDEETLKKIEPIISNDFKVTFHKAVDYLIDNREYKKLKKYNISTVLTQGGLNKIEENLEQIKKIKENLPNIEILLGGGIDQKNINQIIKLNTSIHLGSLARIDKSYNKSYNIDYINEIKEKMLGNYEGLHY